MSSFYQWMLAMAGCVVVDTSLLRTGPRLVGDLVWVTAAYVLAEVLWVIWLWAAERGAGQPTSARVHVSKRSGRYANLGGREGSQHD